MTLMYTAVDLESQLRAASMVGTVLVTGGTGFVGGWCIVELLRRGYAVRTTVRDLEKAARVRESIARGTAAREGIVGNGYRQDHLRVFAADLLRDEGWEVAMTGCDYVLHVASPLGGGTPGDRHALVAPARDGTLRVLQAAVNARVKRVVMTSAAATARPLLSSSQISDETVWADPTDRQFDAYRVSKILAERAAWDFMQRNPGTTELTTLLPGAVFGPILSTDNLGSVQIINGLLHGRPPALPRLGFWIVDVRDLADLHIRAMTSPAAAGQRFIAAGEFAWMTDMAAMLRDELGEQASRVPTRRIPDLIVRLLLPFTPNLRALAPLLGRKFALTTQKVRRVLDFAPRPAAATLADCARSLLTAQGT